MGQIIDLGKLRFQFAGDWASGTTYEVNDVVKYGGNVYVYTSPVASLGNLPTNATYWQLMVPGFAFSGVYDSNTTYKPGNAVAYGGKVYVCILDAAINTLPTNSTYWSLLADGIQWEGTYSNGTTYQKNDIVTYGNGNLYIAKNTTLGNVPTNVTYWDRFVEGVSYQTVYNNAITYYENDLVAYGANIYICKQTTVGNLPTNTTYWDVFVSSILYRNDWATATQYYLNDVVTRGGQTYIATVAHVATTFATDLAANKWTKFSSGVRWRATWVTGTAYITNDLVFDGTSSTYIALNDFTSSGSIATDISNGNLSMMAAGAPGTPAITNSTKTKLLSNDGVGTTWVPKYLFTQYIDLNV